MSITSPSKRRRDADPAASADIAAAMSEIAVPTSSFESPTKRGRQQKQAIKTYAESISSVACFGAGCYWGTEHYIMNKFGKSNGSCILSGMVGFMGPEGSKVNPSYKEVCSGSTGHVEVYECEFSGGDETYRKLVKFFFSFHDPTTANCQGNDRGTQYASVIYCSDDKQFQIASEVKRELQDLIGRKLVKCYKKKIVQTDIRMRTVFYPAHAEHQEYLLNNPTGYCNHKIRFSFWPDIKLLDERKKRVEEGADSDVVVLHSKR